MNHVDHLLFEMAGFGGSAVVHHGQGSTGHTINLPRFASAMALTVIRRKLYDHVYGKFDLPTHENALPGDKNIVKYHGGAVFGIADITSIAAVQFSSIQTGTTYDMDQTRRIIGDGKGQRIILVTFSQGSCG